MISKNHLFNLYVFCSGIAIGILLLLYIFRNKECKENLLRAPVRGKVSVKSVPSPQSSSPSAPPPSTDDGGPMLGGNVSRPSPEVLASQQAAAEQARQAAEQEAQRAAEQARQAAQDAASRAAEQSRLAAAAEQARQSQEQEAARQAAQAAEQARQAAQAAAARAAMQEKQAQDAKQAAQAAAQAAQNAAKQALKEAADKEKEAQRLAGALRIDPTNARLKQATVQAAIARQNASKQESIAKEAALKVTEATSRLEQLRKDVNASLALFDEAAFSQPTRQPSSVYYASLLGQQKYVDPAYIQEEFYRNYRNRLCNKC